VVAGSHAHDHGHGSGYEAGPASRAADRGVRRLLLAVVIPLGLITVVGLVALWPSGHLAIPAEVGPPVEVAKATVEAADLEPCPEEQGGAASTCQVLTLRLTSGPNTATRTELVFNVVANPGIPVFERGDRIIVQSLAPGLYTYVDVQRDRPLLLLGLGFAVLVVALARWKGLAALVGLAVTLLVLVKFILPSILDGNDPVLVCIVGAAATMFVVFYLALGVNIRSSTALIGTIVSLAVTGVLARAVTEAAHLTGRGSEEALTLSAFAGQVDLHGLFLGGIIIGGLGVLNDVTITQASAVWQLHLADPGAGARLLYRQGMAVGRDHIGATVDTLVLAYAGAALPLLIFFSLADRSVQQVLTSSIVAEEVVRSLVGAVGLVLSVPLTTALAAFASARAHVPTDAANLPPSAWTRIRDRLPVRRDPFVR
jgi:uncharacterized membrane protein